MQSYMSIKKATSGLKAKGNIYLIHLMFEDKLLIIGTKKYISREQFIECRAKDLN
jgi:hypothetical protein